jgi:hypothetical protein
MIALAANKQIMGLKFPNNAFLNLIYHEKVFMQRLADN